MLLTIDTWALDVLACLLKVAHHYVRVLFVCSPSSAESREFAVEAGDLLLVATDGVFDNLPLSSLLQLLQSVEGTSELAVLQGAANLIAQRARAHAFDEEYMSPFALNARNNGINAQGKISLWEVVWARSDMADKSYIESES